jgi:hypothetical protein
LTEKLPYKSTTNRPAAGNSAGAGSILWSYSISRLPDASHTGISIGAAPALPHRHKHSVPKITESRVALKEAPITVEHEGAAVQLVAVFASRNGDLRPATGENLTP